MNYEVKSNAIFNCSKMHWMLVLFLSLYPALKFCIIFVANFIYFLSFNVLYLPQIWGRLLENFGGKWRIRIQQAQKHIESLLPKLPWILQDKILYGLDCHFKISLCRNKIERMSTSRRLFFRKTWSNIAVVNENYFSSSSCWF